MNDCIFCKIVTKEIPSEILFEDENFLAILDIKPINPGHSLLIPKKHSRTFLDFNESNANLVEALQKVCTAVKNGVSAEGVNVSTNIERAAGQIIFHTHFHIIPRFSNDGLVHWGHRDYAQGEMEQIASKIRNSF